MSDFFTTFVDLDWLYSVEFVSNISNQNSGTFQRIGPDLDRTIALYSVELFISTIYIILCNNLGDFFISVLVCGEISWWYRYKIQTNMNLKYNSVYWSARRSFVDKYNHIANEKMFWLSDDKAGWIWFQIIFDFSRIFVSKNHEIITI